MQRIRALKRALGLRRHVLRGIGSGVSLAAALWIGACGEPPVAPPQPAALRLTASDTITVTGGRITFSVTALDTAGMPLSGVPIVWSVSDTARGRVAEDGTFTALAPGRVHVRAAHPIPLFFASLAESLAVQVVAPGTVKWRWAAAEAGGVFPVFGGPALANDGTVYVLVNTGGFPDFPGTVVALAPDGTVRWTRPLVQVAGSIGLVVMPESERLWLVGERAYLIEPGGAVVWDTSTVAVSSSFKMGAATDSLMIGVHGFRVAVYRADSRAVIWESQDAPASSWLVPATLTADGRLLAKRTEDTLFVFNAADGQLLRIFEDPDTALDKRVFGVGTVPVGDRYYLPTVKRLAAYDTSGVLLWLTEDTGRGMSEPAVGPDGTLYVQNRLHGLWALTPDGMPRWERFDIQPRWPWLGGVALAEGGILYAPGIDAFWAVNTDGVTLWQHVADSAGVPQAFTGSPAIAPDGTVYTFTATHLYAFWAVAPPEPNSPWPMWRHDAQRTGWAR